MKSKKLISLFCAAAMTASAFAGLATTASAADDNVLWSDTFDSYSNGVDHQTNVAAVGKVLVDGTAVAKNEYAGIEGVTLITTDRADDSSYFKVTDDAGVGKALTTTVSRFSNASRGSQIVFDETYAPDASSDLVLAFKVKVENAGETTYDEAIQLNGDNTQTINFVDDLGIELDTWTDVKIVITTSGTSVYVDNSTTASKTLSTNTLSSIKFNGLVDGVSDDSSSGAQKAGTSHPLGYPTISFDNAVVYTTAAGEGATATTPAAETHGPVDIKYDVVPEGATPEGLGLIASDNINSEATDRLVYINTTEADSTYSGLNSVIVSCGTDTSTHSETKWSVVGNTKTDPALGTEKYLEAVSSVKSAANRGPKMEFKYGEIAERETVVAQFATRLHKSDTSPAEVVFSSDLVASASKGNLSSPLAMITTDATAASGVYACDNPLEQGGANVIEVEDNKWVLVTIEAYRSEGKTAGAKISVNVDGTTTYIFGSESEYADMKDSTKSGISVLPYISFRSGNSVDYYGEGSGSDTINDIDNIAVYSSNSDVQPTQKPTPTPEPIANATMTLSGTDVTITSDIATNAVLVRASYDTSNALEAIKVLKNIELAANTAKTESVLAAGETELTKGDKIMLWDNTKRMAPLAAAITVTEGAEQPTPVPPTPTPEPPTPEPTPEPTYTVSGTVDEGVLRVRLIDKNDEHNAIEAVIADGKATVTDIKAGTYTINVGYNGGYEADTITPESGEIEVTGDNAEAFAVVSKISEKPAITGTVTISGTAEVGETLTAVVEGLNAGETATYEWRAKAAGSEAFVAIEGATSSTLEITKAMVGDQIKVVVKSEGTSGQLDSEPTEAVPAPTYELTVAQAENGTVKVLNGDDEVAAPVAAGTSLKVVATANSGYGIKTITVAPTTEGSSTTVAVADDGTFTMPDEAVTVTVEFEYNGVFTITPDTTYVNFQTAVADTSYEGTTPTIAGYVKISGGKFMETNQAYVDTATMTIISIDASEYLNKIDDAVLTFGGKSSGANTTVRYGTYSNYIDIASDDVTVTASNVNSLGGTAAIVGDVGGVNTSSVTELSLNIKDILKGAADGKATIVLLTSTGRATEITDVSVSVQAAETAYETATAVVHTVYEDAAGTISVGGKNYTEFGTATSVTMYAGDKFTPTYTAVIDDNTKTTRYDYVSGADEVTTVAGTNDIYLVYDKTDYQTVTFTTKVGDTLTASVPVKVNGTPTVTGEAIAETTVTTGEDATAEIKLLPGAYTYAVDATQDYVAKEVTNFTVADTAVAIDVVLTANTKASATLKAVYTTDGTANGKVKEVTVYGEDDNKFADDVVSADTLASYCTKQKVYDEQDTALYSVYNYVSGGTDAVTLAGGENTVYITVSSAGADKYYYNEDFSDYEVTSDASSYGIATMAGNSYARILETLSNQSNVFNIYLSAASGNRAQSIKLSDGAAAGKKAKVSFLLQTTLTGGGDTFYKVVDSSGTEIFGLAHANSSETTVSFGGTATETKFTWTNRGSVQEVSGAGARNTSNWLKVEAEIDFTLTENNVKLTVTDMATNATLVDGVTGTTAAKNIATLSMQLGKSIGALALDDIYVTPITD